MAMCLGTILTATARRRRQIDGLAWAAAADRRLGVGSGGRSTAWRGQRLQIDGLASTEVGRYLRLGVGSVCRLVDGWRRQVRRQIDACSVCSSVARRWQPAWRQSGGNTVGRKRDRAAGRRQFGDYNAAPARRRTWEVCVGGGRQHCNWAT
jgi:hypothetical protein